LAVAKLNELELVVIGDEAEAVFMQIAADLLGLGEGGEAFARRFYLNGPAFGPLVGQRLGLAAIVNRKQTAIGKACAAAAGMSHKDHAWLQSFANPIE